MEAKVVSSRPFARSTREASTQAAGVMPTSLEKAREKFRGLMHARSASASTEQSPPGLARTHSWTSRSGRRSAVCAASAALNCDWPPGRLANSTSQRATSSAASAPRSSSTRASARSIPAVTPAEVHTLPSRTKMLSESTSSAG